MAMRLFPAGTCVLATLLVAGAAAVAAGAVLGWVVTVEPPSSIHRTRDDRVGRRRSTD